MRIYRILVVDDDEDARVLLIRALAKSALALEVATAADGRQALEAVARRRPDAIITDIMMPRMDGFDLCIALRADPATEDIPVIMVTALEGELDRVQCAGRGRDRAWLFDIPRRCRTTPRCCKQH